MAWADAPKTDLAVPSPVHPPCDGVTRTKLREAKADTVAWPPGDASAGCFSMDTRARSAASRRPRPRRASSAAPRSQLRISSSPQRHRRPAFTATSSVLSSLHILTPYISEQSYDINLITVQRGKYSHVTEGT